ncbi:hypothetical protein [Modestobacter sp. NPDC049651]|uniref:hypothetical protein n=1 Tax=unclassified Modestobacter TaxID=2643866 RepID=UPI00340449AA
MSDQQHRPVPGPPPGPRPGPAVRADEDRFAGLAGRPVAEHVGVFDAELERLQRELSTIDQL